MSVRTDQMEDRYTAAKAAGTLVPLHKLVAVKDYTYWKLVHNMFPHDKLNTRHYMVVLKRECPDIWQGLTNNEIYELWREILPSLDKEFHYFKLNGAALRSIQNVPHIHVCDHKEEYV